MKDVDEVVREILAGTEGLINNHGLGMKAQFKKIDNRLNKKEAGQSRMKDQVDGDLDS